LKFSTSELAASNQLLLFTRITTPSQQEHIELADQQWLRRYSFLEQDKRSILCSYAALLLASRWRNGPQGHGECRCLRFTLAEQIRKSGVAVRIHWGALLALCCTSMTLQFWSLRDYWINTDEGIFYFWASLPSFQDVSVAVKQQAHPPLYGFFLYALKQMGATLDLLRMTSVVAASVAVWLTYLLARESGTRFAAVMSAGAVAVGQGFLEVGSVLRPYAVTSLFMLAAQICFLRSCAGRSKYILLAALCTMLGGLFHYSSFLLFFSAGASQLLVCRSTWGPRQWYLYIAGNLIGCFTLLWLAHEGYFNYVTNEKLSLYYKTVLSEFFVTDVSSALFALWGVPHYFLGRFGTIYGVVCAWGAICCWRERNRCEIVAAILAAILALAFAIWQMYPLGGCRYSLWLFLTTIPLFARGISHFERNGFLAPAICVAAFATIPVFIATKIVLEALCGHPFGLISTEPRITAYEAHALKAEIESRSGRQGVLLLNKGAYFGLSPLLAFSEGCQQCMSNISCQCRLNKRAVTFLDISKDYDHLRQEIAAETVPCSGITLLFSMAWTASNSYSSLQHDLDPCLIEQTHSSANYFTANLSQSR
jgi:Dolichyl-phosphate-mannose-protein mannosyltransferase